MTWNRRHSKLEDLMAAALKNSKSGLSLREIVEQINKVEPDIFTGESQIKSLYSIIYRKEQRRVSAMHELRFVKLKNRNVIVYKLNPNFRTKL